MDELEVPLAVFAADISGNPHYFDRGTLPGQLLTQAVCWLEQAELPENSYEWRERMEQAGILPDNVSSSLHAFGLLLYLGQQAHPAYEAFCRLRQPFVITMENLRGVTGAEPLGERIYIVENEMVFSYLVAHLIKSGEEKQGEQKNTRRENPAVYAALHLRPATRGSAETASAAFKKRRIHLLQRRYRSGRNADCRPAVAEIRRRDSDLAYVPGGLSEEHFRRTHHRKWSGKAGAASPSPASRDGKVCERRADGRVSGESAGGAAGGYGRKTFSSYSLR